MTLEVPLRRGGIARLEEVSEFSARVSLLSQPTGVLPSLVALFTGDGSG
ncbi:MAG: hypothetical protein Q8K32_22545 [Archangium sp.]|nr:hypothetical protein [Archangium sp.]